MKCCNGLFFGGLSVIAIVAVAGSLGWAQPGTKDATPTKPASAPHGQPAAPAGQPQLPPGMTMDDLKAYMDAATPGAMHARMQECVGTWTGTVNHWMAPDTKPVSGACKAVFSSMMDGKFVKMELTTETPMGPMTGMGIYGFDNVSKKFQSSWIDSMGTGMMYGTGDLTDDKTTINWSFGFTCPITKKACVMREIDRRVDANTTIIEMHGPDPKTGKEFKVMEVTMKRTPTPNSAPAAPAHTPTTPTTPALPSK